MKEQELLLKSQSCMYLWDASNLGVNCAEWRRRGASMLFYEVIDTTSNLLLATHDVCRPPYQVPPAYM